ncbi:MAG: hypothetical protein KDC69_02690 [Flavobacteriaceae bacterium]|nr:hypothetical protein [Flavobacteriaceae bacterium]MCB0474551.1 hypothetical protein [Flavobacteriaceae bacterium]
MNDNLEKRFAELKGQFDIEEPLMGHFDRFETRLNKRDIEKPKSRRHTWLWMAAAASVALLIGIAIGNYNQKQGLDLADVSPQMKETQNFFVSTIQTEMEQIALKRNNDNAKIIDDSFEQLRILEENYKQLTFELQKSNEDNRVIYAMISNFQQRIDVLQNLLQQLNELQNIKNTIDNGKII